MKYRVKLGREVRDLLCAYVEVEADSADAARDAALTEAAEEELDWQLDICDPDPGRPDVVDTVEVHEPATQEG